MDNTKKKIKKESGFDRLPDDLLLAVMNRMADDLRSLCRCSLLSKRFASVVFSIQALSPTIPSHEPFYEMSYEEVTTVFQQTLNYPTDHLTTIIRSSSIEVPKVFLFLQKFNELKSIHLQVDCSSLFLKEEEECRTSWSIIDQFIEVSKEIEQEFSPQLKSCLIKHEGPLYPLRWCRERLIVLCLLVKLQHSLQSVTIADTGEVGMLAVMGEKLVEFRKSLLCRGGSTNFIVPFVQMGWLNKLSSSSSGIGVKGLYFVFFGSAPDSDSSVDCSEAVNLGYEGQEKLLGEVVSEMVKNHAESVVRDNNHFLPWLYILRG